MTVSPIEMLPCPRCNAPGQSPDLQFALQQLHCDLCDDEREIPVLTDEGIGQCPDCQEIPCRCARP